MTIQTAIHPVADKFGILRKQLNSTYLERNDAILASLLAILSGEHVFLLGLPGTGKSQMIRAIVKCIVNARHFEIQLSKTTPAEKVEGPLNVLDFRETGAYHLKRTGYASQVEFLTLDEVGKMSPILGHNLLTLLNERKYHEVNGNLSVHDAPLSTAFTASNETLTDQDDNSAALWDRLLIRVVVDYLADDDNFLSLITGDMSDPDVRIEWSDLQDVILNVVPQITLSEPAMRGYVSLRHEFRREHLNPSDRRWRQTVKVLKAHAFLNGRTEVIEDDLAVLRFMLWDTVEQIDKVNRLCMIAANPYVERLLEVTASIAQIDNGITEREGLDANGNDQANARQQYGRDAINKLTNARTTLDALLMEAAGRPIPGFKAASDDHRRVLKRSFMVCLDQDERGAEVMMKSRLGSGDGGNE